MYLLHRRCRLFRTSSVVLLLFGDCYLIVTHTKLANQAGGEGLHLPSVQLLFQYALFPHVQRYGIAARTVDTWTVSMY